MLAIIITSIFFLLFIAVFIYWLYPIVTCNLPWSHTQYDWRIGTMTIKQKGKGITTYYIIEHKIRAKVFPTKWRYKSTWYFCHYDDEFGDSFHNVFKTIERAQKYMNHLYEDQEPIITEINGKKKYDYGCRCDAGDMDC